ncbi:hypothetical protein LZ30DRAFT_815086 [Colletotrichum cereale]|nr:hypothetical protein LZ30DRAFT_815086 [Colletotrichum cereale]
MSNNQETQEQLCKRSLTPNRPLYNSFNEAHRHIVPATLRTPIEDDLPVEEQLTQEQVEEILKVSNASRELKEQVETGQSQQPVAENQSVHESKFTNQSSASAIESHTKTTDKGPHASASLCESDIEDAFVDSSVSSIHESKDQTDQDNAPADPFSGQQATFDYPDASSFYPEDGDDYYLASTDEDSFQDKVKLEPKSSPALASSPTLPPPIAPDPKNPSQQLLQSHLDDVIKKKSTLDNLDATHLSGQNGTQYPIFIDRGVLPPPAIPAMQPLPIIEHATHPESHYDGDISDISEGHFMGEDKGKASVSRLNPFHAFSGTSSHASDTNAPPSEPDDKKVFLRPHAEKEVSRALHHATGLSLPSSGLIVRQGVSTRTFDSQHSPYRMRSSQQKEDFYHAPAIQSDWQITQSGVKVPVSTSYNEDDVNMQPAEPYSAIDNTWMATVASGDAENRTGLEGDEDWRTVTDDREFPPGAVGRVMTGSSIANVSDALLVRQNQRTRAPTGRKPSATKAWWEKSTQQLSMIPSRSPSPSFVRPPSRVFQQRQLHQEGWEEIELEPMPTPYRDFSWPRIRAEQERARQAVEATPPVNNAYANLPFPLVNLEDAARRQAVRRASGLEDQTLSGRILSPGLPLSSQGGSYALSRPAVRKDSARSMFSRIKNPDFDCRNLSIPGHRDTTFGRPAREYCSTQYSGRAQTPLSRERASTAATARRNASASHQAAVEALANDQSAGRRSSPHLYSAEVMARYRALQAVRQLGGQGTDSELADMAASVRDLPLSERAVARQKAFYRAVMSTTGVLPFVGFAILALSGDRLLAALTRGECSGLSFHQRRNLRIMLLVGCGVWVVAFAGGLISLLALRN